jgi:hypothetical protein
MLHTAVRQIDLFVEICLRNYDCPFAGGPAHVDRNIGDSCGSEEECGEKGAHSGELRGC